MIEKRLGKPTAERDQKVAVRVGQGATRRDIIEEFGSQHLHHHELHRREVERCLTRLYYYDRTDTPEGVYLETEICRNIELDYERRYVHVRLNG